MAVPQMGILPCDCEDGAPLAHHNMLAKNHNQHYKHDARELGRAG
jgi:hypothetical protein